MAADYRSAARPVSSIFLFSGKNCQEWNNKHGVDVCAETGCSNGAHCSISFAKESLNLLLSITAVITEAICFFPPSIPLLVLC